jgi:inner membrane protein
MTDRAATPPTTSLAVKLPARSMGLKLLLVCALALLMAIPALFVFKILYDRTQRAEEVVSQIGGLIGGPQTFLGPVLSVPYTLTTPPPAAGQPASVVSGAYIIYPEVGRVTAGVKTSVRKRGLFKATVWTSDLEFASSFDLSKVAGQPPRGAVLDWSRAELLVGASDARGAQSNVILTVAGQPREMTPALTLGAVGMQGGDEPRRYRGGGDLKFFGASASGLVTPGSRFDVTARATFAGAQRLAVLPHGKTTTFHVVGDWSAPSYDGGFLPVRHGPNPASGKTADQAGSGFVADWSVPFIARGVPGDGTSEVLSNLGGASLGVTFADQADPYQAVGRSLKYAPMFLGLVFLAYFLFETVQKKRVHPAQYVLIGLAQIIFYLLLLSIAERIGFDYGFLISAGATVALISAYAGWVFESRKQGWVAFVAFTLLYALIYILMRLEDWALLVGAVTSFAAIAAVMYFTRRLDWYGGGRGGESVA